MAEAWLTIVGMGEDGVAGLGPRSQAALHAAEVIMGPPRHLNHVPETGAARILWPVPFADGLPMLANLRGRRVVVLASGDPFWFGAGAVIARQFEADEWVSLPGPACFALAASALGWPLDQTACLALHAAPMARLRPHLSPGMRLMATLRDGDAVADLCGYLAALGFGDSRVHIFERLGAEDARHSAGTARDLLGDFAHPVMAAIDVAGDGDTLTMASGQRDDIFDHDGQITKRPVRAITLSTLAPRPFEHLWDVGSGSGSIALEWLLAHPTTRATAFEVRPDRAQRIGANADRLGLSDRLTVIEGAAPEALPDTPRPDVIFVGGGLSQALIEAVTAIPSRLVVNAVTLEGEALLAHAHAAHGGDLMRIELSQSAPLGPKRGWSRAYPVVQWSLAQ